MLLFYGKEAKETVDGLVYDENVSRAARLKALRSHFYAWKSWTEFALKKEDYQTHAFNIAKDKGIANLSGDKSILVLNAHGSPNTFSGMTGEKIAEDLLVAGIQDAGTEEIWVAACNVAQQEQDNTQPPTNLIKEMLNTLRQRIPDIRVYGPRGYIRYSGKQTVTLLTGQTTLEYTTVDIVLLSPKNRDGSRNIRERYDFSNGWLLAQLP
jgi:hypothetical protein